MLLTCCKLDPGNLIYRQELRRNQKAKHKNNMRGGFFAFITTRKPKAKMKWAKRGRDYLRVLEHGEQVLARNPWDTGTQLDMAAAADALGLLDIAIFILSQAREKDGKDATLNRALARLLEKRGNFTEAIKLWELVRQKVPSDAEAQHKAKDLAASETIQRGKYDKAVIERFVGHADGAGSPGGRRQRPGQPRDRQRSRRRSRPTRRSPAPYLQLAALHRRQGTAERGA